MPPRSTDATERFRPLRYLSYPAAVGTHGDLSLRVALHRAGFGPDDDLPVELVRAVRYTDSGTFGMKPKRIWERTTLPAGLLQLSARGPDAARSTITGTIAVTAVADADASTDDVVGLVLERHQLTFVPPVPGPLDAREPHIVLPGVDQRFRNYALIRFLVAAPGPVAVWQRCASIEAEGIALWLGHIAEQMDSIGQAAADQARVVRDLLDELRKERSQRRVRQALLGVMLAIIGKLGTMVAEPVLEKVAPAIQQAIVEAARFLDRFF